MKIFLRKPLLSSQTLVKYFYAVFCIKIILKFTFIMKKIRLKLFTSAIICAIIEKLIK